MSKNRQAVTCNGRPAFYASMYEDIRKCAMDLGWAVAIHGSLKSDMDIMAMPWTEEAVSFEHLVLDISRLFAENVMAENYLITYNEKLYGRIVATIPIWEDFYLDISTIDTRKPMQEIVERLEENSKHWNKKKKEALKNRELEEANMYDAFEIADNYLINFVKEVGGMNESGNTE